MNFIDFLEEKSKEALSDNDYLYSWFIEYIWEKDAPQEQALVKLTKNGVDYELDERLIKDTYNQRSEAIIELIEELLLKNHLSIGAFIDQCPYINWTVEVEVYKELYVKTAIELMAIRLLAEWRKENDK